MPPHHSLHMNILLFSWRDPKHPLAGGAEQVVHEHAKGWVEAGHKVTLFSSAFRGGNMEENLEGVLVKRHGFQLLGVHFLAFVWYIFVTREKFDLVIDQFHGVPFFTPLYVRVPKLAIIQEVAREVWFMNHLPKPIDWIVGTIGYLIEPSIFWLYKNVPFMTGSESAKQDVAAMGINIKNITVIPHGVIVKRPQKSYPKEKIKTLVFLGTLTRDKGIEDAIRAFGYLRQKGNFKFWVIGRSAPEYRKQLENLAEDMGVGDDIRFWGFVSQKKKFDLLARAHVLVNPSIREGWGLVNIEANALGTPVVAYRSQGLVDSVMQGKSGFFSKANTPESLAETIFDLLKNKIVYRHLKKGALHWAESFSWEKSRQLSKEFIKTVH